MLTPGSYGHFCPKVPIAAGRNQSLPPLWQTHHAALRFWGARLERSATPRVSLLGKIGKFPEGGSQRNFPARVIVSINSLGACFSRFALASLAGPLFFKFSKVLIFSLFRGSLGVRSAAGGRRDPRHPKPKPGSFFVAVALSALGFGVIPNKCAGSLLAIQGHCLRGAFGTSKHCLPRRFTQNLQ